MSDITGSVDAPKPKEDKPADPAKRSRPAGGRNVVYPDLKAIPASERAVLERLQERRQELDTRAREIDIRESLLKAAEKRIEGKVEEMKGIEARITKATGQQKDEADKARFKGLVTMYENMKPRDAGKIFDRLEMAVLIEVASRMKPQKMADVLAQMQPECPEALTVETGAPPGRRRRAGRGTAQDRRPPGESAGLSRPAALNAINETLTAISYQVPTSVPRAPGKRASVAL